MVPEIYFPAGQLPVTTRLYETRAHSKKTGKEKRKTSKSTSISSFSDPVLSKEETLIEIHALGPYEPFSRIKALNRLMKLLSP